MLRQLLLMMVLFTVMRIAFYFFNRTYFPDVSLEGFLKILLGGFRFDLSAILYSNILFVLLLIIPFPFRANEAYQKIVKGIFIFCNSVIIALNCIDFIYFRFTLRRTTFSVFREFRNEANGRELALRFFLDYWYMVVVFIILCCLIYKAYGKILSSAEKVKAGLKYYLINTAVFCACIYLFIISVRGGFTYSSRPITLSNAGDYVERPLEMAIVLNTPFAIYRTIGIKQFQKPQYFSSDTLINIFSPLHQPDSSIRFTPRNVVVIIIESFGKEYIGALNGKGKGFTPFVDSLVKHSKVFEYSFANGKKSIDAMPSVLASIPSIGEPYILTPYSGNKINSIASLLKDKGYATGFFHGAPNGSMGFSAFANIAGFDKYFGKTEFNNDAEFDGTWGIWDEPFLQFYAEQMNKMPEPFCTALFTVSSHHPFEVPDKYKGKLPEGNLRIHKCIAYTDQALKKFFASASKMKWFNNTLFVITADHTNTDSYYPEFKTSMGVFSVPVIFYAPGDIALVGHEPKLVQQIDIMPTALSYLGYDKPYIAFGSNALANDPERFVVNYNGFYQIFMGDHLLQSDGAKSIAMYDYKKDIMLQENLLDKQPEERKKLETKLKAFIQQYYTRLIDNQLSIKEDVVN